jgi:hypothetical protein
VESAIYTLTDEQLKLKKIKLKKTDEQFFRIDRWTATDPTNKYEVQRLSKKITEYSGIVAYLQYNRQLDRYRIRNPRERYEF